MYLILERCYPHIGKYFPLRKCSTSLLGTKAIATKMLHSFHASRIYPLLYVVEFPDIPDDGVTLHHLMSTSVWVKNNTRWSMEPVLRFVWWPEANTIERA